MLVESFLTVQGPFSAKSPSRDEPPGPPFSQIARGASWGAERDSKNQKNLAQSQHDLTDRDEAQLSRIDGIVLFFPIDIVQQTRREMNMPSVGLCRVLQFTDIWLLKLAKVLQTPIPPYASPLCTKWSHFHETWIAKSFAAQALAETERQQVQRGPISGWHASECGFFAKNCPTIVRGPRRRNSFIDHEKD